jgi:isoamylase
MSDAASSEAVFVPGVRWTGSGAVFSLSAPAADRVWLMLFDEPGAETPAEEIELDPARHRDQGRWSIEVPSARPGRWYAWRADGPHPPFDPGQWLIDPSAEILDWNRVWGDARGLKPGVWPQRGAGFPKARLVRDTFDWGGDRPPRTPWRDTVIYEAHLRGFTAHPSAGVAAPGTYAAFAEKIPHLRALGVTAVEFLPLHEFNELEFLHEGGTRRALRNFWGYSPVGFFAPQSRYAAAGSAGAGNEFRALVRALHAADIEVILDVVFNHTGEWDRYGPTYAFKALDPHTWYLHEDHGSTLSNFTGCGNTVNANHPAVTAFLLACLRHWVRAYHVDGFRFDLAAALTRGPDGPELARPPLIERISGDPELREVKLIAEAWDAVGLYQVGRFPGTGWSEWNGRFRDDLRRFWHGFGVTAGGLATRLAGSADLYGAAPEGPRRSVNYITAHDGFTLADLVAYERPHNRDNGEQNRDGERHNFSLNGGAEGPSADPAVRARRARLQRCHLASLLVAQGVPMLLAGDEFGRTQRGNNNAYAQDSDVSWVDWSLLDAHRDLHDFTRTLIAFRCAHPALRRTTFLRGEPGADGRRDVEWHGPEGGPPRWDDARSVALRLDGARAHTGADRDDADLWIVFNGEPHPVLFHAPAATAPWRMAWSTETPEPPPPLRNAWTAPAVSVTAFTAAQSPEGA